MPILNETLDFNSAPPAVRSAFRRGQATRTLLKAGTTRLDRLVTPTVSKVLSEWWTRSATTSTHLARAQRAGTSPIDLSRARAAVTKQWNPAMNTLVRVALIQDVYGFVGQAAHQQTNANGPGNVVFIGGAEQIWIPNLTPAHARIVFHGPMPE